MKFKEWYQPAEFLEQALGGILAMNLSHRIDEARKDPGRLRNQIVARDEEGASLKQQDLFAAQKSDDDRAEEERARFDQSGKRREWDRCERTPLSAYEREIKTLQLAARSNANTFAQLLIFSPLSANVNFAKHWDNIPVLYNVLTTLFPDKIKPIDASDEQFKGDPARIIEKWLLPFNEKMYGLGATISGWKYDTIAYVWNHRRELKQELESIADSDGSDADLIMAMRNIPGVKPVKAGFIAQILYGKAGCIDTHNIDIYSRAFPDMKDELNDKRWRNYGSETPKGLETTRKTIGDYTGTLQKLKSRGIGTAELWDVWVDFVGRMYKAILPGGLYTNKKGPALNPNDPKYKALKNTIPKERILASGKADKGKFVGVDAISGDEAGGGASLTHDLPRHHPHSMLKQLFKADRGDKDAEDFTQAIVRQPKMMGPRPAAVHYLEPALDQDTGEVDPERLKDLLQGYGSIGGERMRRKMARRAEDKRSLFQ